MGAHSILEKLRNKMGEERGEEKCSFCLLVHPASGMNCGWRILAGEQLRRRGSETFHSL